MKKPLIILAVLSSTIFVNPSLVYAKKNVDIIGWEEIVAYNGFVLSKDLDRKRHCSQIWDKQIPEFQKRNPHIEDPDKIVPGTKILIQRCKDIKIIANKEPSIPKIHHKKKEKMIVDEKMNEDKISDIKVNEEKKPITEEIVYKSLPVANIVNSEIPVKKEDKKIPSPYLNLYVGFLSEKKNEAPDSMYGASVTGDTFSFLGYNIRLNGSQSVIASHNELRFKTNPANYRTHFIIGLGNRIGIKNKDIDRLKKGVDSFTYSGVGFEMNPGNKYKLLIDITANVGLKFSPNFSASAQKKVGDDQWLGLFMDWYSTRSVIDNKEDRRMIMSGLKYSF